MIRQKESKKRERKRRRSYYHYFFLNKLQTSIMYMAHQPIHLTQFLHNQRFYICNVRCSVDLLPILYREQFHLTYSQNSFLGRCHAPQSSNSWISLKRIWKKMSFFKTKQKFSNFYQDQFLF